MPFRAIFDATTVSAWTFGATEWRLLAAAARERHDRLRVRCCGANAVPCISRLDRKYFRHRIKPLDCTWSPESDEHLELKAAVRQAAEHCGWQAEVEHIGPDWKADVLARRGFAKVAFEVQLSTQGQRETAQREAKYFASSVFPWWIVNSRNNGDGFGSNRRSCVIGRTEVQRSSSAQDCVRDVLGRIERQVAIAKEVRAALAARGINSQIHSIGKIPAVFEFSVSDRKQFVVIGEIGEEAVPNLDQIRADSKTLPWGAVVQFVDRSEQIRGFKSSAFYLKGKPLKQEICRTLDNLIDGKKRWYGIDDTERIEAAFVWYEDTCPTCHESYARVPFVISGHLKVRAGAVPTLYQFDGIEDGIRSRLLKKLEMRIGKPIGTLIFRPRTHVESSFIPMHQICFCRKGVIEKSLISGADALLWPNTDIDFYIQVPVRETGWIAPQSVEATRHPDRNRWAFRLATKRIEHLSERLDVAARRVTRSAQNELVGALKRLESESKQFFQSCSNQLQLDERRLKQEYDKRTNEHWNDYVLNAQLKRAQEKLEGLAAHRWRNAERARLWMRTYDQQLGGKPVDMCLNHFDLCVRRLKVL